MGSSVKFFLFDQEGLAGQMYFAMLAEDCNPRVANLKMAGFAVIRQHLLGDEAHNTVPLLQWELSAVLPVPLGGSSDYG